MKILVLGSSGQIGLSLVKFLRNKKHEVIEFDIEKNQSEDLRIPFVLDELLPSIDFVFFLAYDVGGSKYLKKYQNTYEFLDNNVKIIKYTFDSLKKYNKKFIFTSTQMSNMIDSSYGLSKRIGEMYTENLGGIVAKLWNVYGYEHDFEKSHVITDFVSMVKKDNKIKMRTNGEEKRQFLFSEDCCECLNILMEKYDSIDKKQCFYISSFEWTKIIDVANIIKKINPDCEIIPNKSLDSIQSDKKNEPSIHVLNYWKPKVSLEDGIRKIYEMY
jgi:nucleoside-diphosphate-sugar epimerase